jgi:hypothetical protein
MNCFAGDGICHEPASYRVEKRICRAWLFLRRSVLDVSEDRVRDIRVRVRHRTKKPAECGPCNTSFAIEELRERFLFRRYSPLLHRLSPVTADAFASAPPEADIVFSTSPRRSRRLPPHPNEAPGFPCRPIRDARSAEWELTSPLSLTLKVRGHGFQMHHYRYCARNPLSRGL